MCVQNVFISGFFKCPGNLFEILNNDADVPFCKRREWKALKGRESPKQKLESKGEIKLENPSDCYRMNPTSDFI